MAEHERAHVQLRGGEASPDSSGLYKIYYAHTRTDSHTGALLPESSWQPLDEHLREVARLSEEFSSAFHAGAMGAAAGLLHDIGKATTAFEARLRGSKAPADHKTQGARAAIERYSNIKSEIGWARLLAYIICGHHGGLPDADAIDGAASLEEMLKRESESVRMRLPDTPGSLRPARTTSTRNRAFISFYFQMLARMLFSALVDADYLDTERVMSPDTSSARGSFPPLDKYADMFEPKLRELLGFPQTSPVFKARRDVLLACLNAAELAPGLFKLTVPTGGGKTLSSLAFALRHARAHNLRRIVYAIPFTSITEQNANVFRSIFGDERVLEHHSNMGEGNICEGEYDHKNINRLASENWDAPLIVTTNVQLFESLFSAKPSKCRKLHRLANSVIILDEAQTLPDAFLLPTLAALKTLAADFGATIVFCTATQPAFKPEWLDGMPIREIVGDTTSLFNALSRVRVRRVGALTNELLAERLREHKQALCIVNTRGHARKLFDMLGGGEGRYHLSALMCAEHRTRVIKQIKARLKLGLPCVVVSTQLIEAGVDIDFPYVYRAVAGLDAIAQAAGRCNREGRLTNESGEAIPGEVFVFTPEGGLLTGCFQKMATLGEETLREFDDPLKPEAVARFFMKRYGLSAELDEKRILESIAEGVSELNYNFRDIDKKYKIIEDATDAVIIPFDDDSRAILEAAEASMFPGKFRRKLQRYTVSIYPYEFQELRELGAIRELGGDRSQPSGMYVLAVSDADYCQFYNENTGLNTKPEWNLLLV
ncbi:MAG: CRISPR-associated helicase Cas3' [Oscillospiraceae bacterium]|jgi:CRISPR-associated helicase Cas3/CRISPR-associated endonuclease Cas3-HD|nr:CRISPR-associated helicase Cas3' [Oscillospiraceae bacterium]